jgi:hypothetical protein
MSTEEKPEVQVKVKRLPGSPATRTREKTWRRESALLHTWVQPAQEAAFSDWLVTKANPVSLD